MIPFGQQLNAQTFDTYITSLEAQTKRAGHFEQWHHTQQQLWHDTCQQLQLGQQPTQSTIQDVLQRRVQLLEEIVQTTVGGLDWPELIIYLQPYLPDVVTHGYFLKPERLEHALIQHPPERTLAYLGYSSLAEYLRQESLYELLAVLRFTESASWMQTHLQLYQDVRPIDFEYRAVQFLRLAPERWWTLAQPFAEKKKHHFSHLKEVGLIFYYPAPAGGVRPPLHITLLLLLHYVFEVHFYANWFEQQLLRLNSLGEYFSQTLVGDQTICAVDQRHLPILQQYHLKLPQPPQCAFEPHVMSEALHWRKAAGIFFDLLRRHPQFGDVAFWEKCYTVGQWHKDRFVHFNVMDNILSGQDWFDYHFREDVWNDLFAIYTSPAQVEQLIIDYFSIKQIDLNALTTHI